MPELERPRIFGMTASPIDAKADVVQAAAELESLLHSTIATTTDMSLTDAIKKPDERLLRYSPLLRGGLDTELARAVKARFPDIAMFEQIYDKGKHIAVELGRWCADLYLTDALSGRKLWKYEKEAERKYFRRPQAQDETIVSQLDEKVAQMRLAIEYVATEQSKYVQVSPQDLSSKVKELQEYLKFQFERPSSHRCIVFVERRSTTRLLCALFKKIGTRHMHGGFLVGTNNPELDQDNVTYRQQILTLIKFRKGEINCLFATSVAEEGLAYQTVILWFASTCTPP